MLTCLLVNRAGADARTVRPYMPQSMQLVDMSTYLLVNRAGVDARTVRPYIPQSMQLVDMLTCLLVNRAGVDARTGRPYIDIMAGLMYKMVDIVSRVSLYSRATPLLLSPFQIILLAERHAVTLFRESN